RRTAGRSPRPSPRSRSRGTATRPTCRPAWAGRPWPPREAREAEPNGPLQRFPGLQPGRTIMDDFSVGYFVGSLSSSSINRKLAGALVKLAPEPLKMREIPIRDLPLYSQDYDTNYPQ